MAYNSFQRQLEVGYEQVAVMVTACGWLTREPHDESKIVWKKVQPKKEGVA